MRLGFLYIFLLFLSFIFIFFPSTAYLVSYNPFNYITNYRLSSYAFISNMFRFYFDLVDVRKENAILREKLNYYKTFSYELQKCQNEARQFYYISNSLAFINKQSNPNVYISRVVGYDTSGKKSFLEIQNNGKIKEGDIVSSNGYFVGVVYKVYKDVAYVMTVYNKLFNTIVYDYRTGDTYIYKGGYPDGSIINATSSDDIRVGDLIYFRSLKNQDIPYLLVGKVLEVNRSKNLFFLNVKLRPMANPNIYDFVVVLNR
ncbi:MAG: rod shape-determining protein MreC [Hydrogenobaculum sp.]